MTTTAPPAVPVTVSVESVRPSTTKRTYSTAWWGMVMLIATEGMIFLGLLGSYFFLRAAAKQWPPPGIELPEFKDGLIFSVVLWGSSFPLIWAERKIKEGDRVALRAALLTSFVMGLAFLAYTLVDFDRLHYGWRDNSYGSIFYTIVGLHAIHVGIGLAMNLVVQIKAWAGKITAERHQTLQIFSLYWHFVDAVWLLVFPSLFLSPHIR
jgi:heme/copper-type cytochrome/quinol oxidase subunit 3